jgi:hypothetical protein
MKMKMANTVKAEQLRIWDDETGSHMKFAAIAEWQQWCVSLRAYGLTTPTLDPSDERAVAFAGAYHDVLTDFDELEAPAFRTADQPGLSHRLTERLLALRLLQSAMNECRRRSLRVPREMHRLRAAISRQIYSLRSVPTPASSEQRTDACVV